MGGDRGAISGRSRLAHSPITNRSGGYSAGSAVFAAEAVPAPAGASGKRAEVQEGVAAVRVLGPIEVSIAGRAVPLGGAQQRLLFAALALHMNAVVPADVLVDL